MSGGVYTDCGGAGVYIPGETCSPGGIVVASGFPTPGYVAPANYGANVALVGRFYAANGDHQTNALASVSDVETVSPIQIPAGFKAMSADVSWYAEDGDGTGELTIYRNGVAFVSFVLSLSSGGKFGCQTVTFPAAIMPPACEAWAIQSSAGAPPKRSVLTLQIVTEPA
jgi:hypothetical protein